MTLGLIGKKLGMTQVFSEDGTVAPVTVIQAGPCKVNKVRTEEKNGYRALQLGFDLHPKQNKVKRPVKGQFKESGGEAYRYLREFRMDDTGDYKPGDEVKVDIFSPGQLVDVTGVSKGKGFAGVVKRHNVSGGKDTHGSRHHRVPGSIGASADPARTVYGVPMPGHHGAKRTTVQNLTVVEVDSENNVILVQGAVPGGPNALVTIKPAVKAG